MSQDQVNTSNEIKASTEDPKPSTATKAKKSQDVEEGEVVGSKDKSKGGAEPGSNGDEKGEKDKAKSDKSQDDDDERDGDKKSKKKKKDKSKKKEKDKKSEKKADKKEKHSGSRERKSKKDKDREKSDSRSRSRHDNRKHKKRSKSRSKDTRRKNERSGSRSKRRSTSRSKRRSPSYTKQKDRRQGNRDGRDGRDSREKSREQRRRSRSQGRREKPRERRDEKESGREDRRGGRGIERKEKEKESKMEVVEDEPIDEEAMKKIESELALGEEDEEQAAARAREQRKALLEKLRKTSEEVEKKEEENMEVEEEKKEEESKEEKVADKKKVEKVVKQKVKRELSKPAESGQGGNEGGEQGKKMEEENKGEEEEQSPKKRATMTHKHDTDKEKYIKLIENMREKLQKEEEDLRENGEGEEGEEGGKKVEEEEKTQNVGQDFDMFCETPESVEAENEAAPIVNADNAVHDDENGYYRAQIGEIVNGRYKIIGKLGKGVFGNVFRANDTETSQDVAMKVVKSEEIYTMSGLKEKEILNMLNEADRHNKRHVIRLLDSFDYRRHLVLVFEIMEMDLRSAIKTFGKKLGLSIESVRSYARQLFIALAHLKKYKIIHADLKPDNILVTNNQKTLKLSDFGSAFPIEENTITPYLVARYYRAPEIILGCPYDTAVDTWSAACTIFELYTGKMLFPGRDNNEMLKLIMHTKGRFNNKMLKRGEFSSQYFDHQNNFLSTEIDPVTKLKYVKPIPIGNKITRDIGNLLNAVEIELSEEDRKKIVQLKDLLERCLTLEPNRRISPDEVLRHPFINYTVQKLAVDQNTIKHAF